MFISVVALGFSAVGLHSCMYVSLVDSSCMIPVPVCLCCPSVALMSSAQCMGRRRRFAGLEVSQGGRRGNVTMRACTSSCQCCSAGGSSALQVVVPGLPGRSRSRSPLCRAFGAGGDILDRSEVDELVAISQSLSVSSLVVPGDACLGPGLAEQAASRMVGDRYGASFLAPVRVALPASVQFADIIGQQHHRGVC